jgi:hypothetical protein
MTEIKNSHSVGSQSKSLVISPIDLETYHKSLSINLGKGKNISKLEINLNLMV